MLKGTTGTLKIRSRNRQPKYCPDVRESDFDEAADCGVGCSSIMSSWFPPELTRANSRTKLLVQLLVCEKDERKYAFNINILVPNYGSCRAHQRFVRLRSCASTKDKIETDFEVATRHQPATWAEWVDARVLYIR